MGPVEKHQFSPTASFTKLGNDTNRQPANWTYSTGPDECLRLAAREKVGSWLVSLKSWADGLITNFLDGRCTVAQMCSVCRIATSLIVILCTDFTAYTRNASMGLKVPPSTDLLDQPSQRSSSVA